MTNELAIQEMLTVASHLKQTSQGGAIMRGVVALDKQIPKKPVLIEGKMWTCPTCDNNLHWKYAEYPNKQNGKGLPYCLCCGQAIDWSGNND